VDSFNVTIERFADPATLHGHGREAGALAPRPLPDRAARRERLFVAAALGAFLAYAAAFIYRTSFVVDGERYFSLFDDAMVSMRYAQNVADGLGAVWNPGGERVEGYTNPLWVAAMAAIHLLPMSEAKTSLVVQIAAALLLAANLVYVRRTALAVSGGATAVGWAALTLTATYLPINFWSLQGMEVSLLVLIMSVCTTLALQTLDTHVFPRRLYALLAAGTLVRPDMVVPFVAFLAFLVVCDPVHRRRHLSWGLALLAATIGVQTLGRYWYYGDVLPNTYYLKMTGVDLAVRLARGLDVLARFVWQATPLLFLLPCALLLRRDRRIWLLLWLLGGQMAYSVYVGGDAWEYWGGSNRYISLAMPGFFIALAYALYLLARAFMSLLHASAPGVVVQPSRCFAGIYALAVLYAVFSMNSIHGVGALAEVALLRPTLHTGEGGGNQRDVRHARLIREVTAPLASVAVMRAGTIPYFAHRPAVDMLGKNDAYIAHGPSAVSLTGYQDFRPGHMKHDFAHSIGRRQPDVVMQLRRRTALAQPYLEGRYESALLPDGSCAFLRTGSPRIRWERVPMTPCPPAASAGGDD
jgi:hypothetical protein